jgi:hypothetical protein
MNIYMTETDYRVLSQIYQPLTEKCMISSADPGQTIACCRQIIL